MTGPPDAPRFWQQYFVDGQHNGHGTVNGVHKACSKHVVYTHVVLQACSKHVLSMLCTRQTQSMLCTRRSSLQMKMSCSPTMSAFTVFGRLNIYVKSCITRHLHPEKCHIWHAMHNIQRSVIYDTLCITWHFHYIAWHLHPKRWPPLARTCACLVDHRILDFPLTLMLSTPPAIYSQKWAFVVQPIWPAKEWVSSTTQLAGSREPRTCAKHHVCISIPYDTVTRCGIYRTVPSLDIIHVTSWMFNLKHIDLTTKLVVHLSSCNWFRGGKQWHMCASLAGVLGRNANVLRSILPQLLPLVLVLPSIKHDGCCSVGLKAVASMLRYCFWKHLEKGAQT